jgi:hypothetical protein
MFRFTKTVYANTVHSTHASQAILYSHNTDSVCRTSIIAFNQACSFLLSTGCGSVMMVSLKTETCSSSLHNFNIF